MPTDAKDHDDLAYPATWTMDADGPRAEEANLQAGDQVVAALRTDVEERGLDVKSARQLRGVVVEVRGGDSNVVAKLHTGWCINPGDRIIFRRALNKGEGDG